MKPINVYNQNGEKKSNIKLDDNVFGVEKNDKLISKAVITELANHRTAHAKTKTCAQVRGGGAKPWRQKGTGRARHGSIRSPIWRGGGVTFGPTGREVFKKRIPKKMRRKALFMVLSAKAKENLIFVLDNLKIEKPKTKIMVEILEQLFLKKSSGLLVLPKIDENIIKSVRNIPKIDPIQAKDLNVLDLLNYKYIVMPKEAIKVIKETFMN